MTAAEVAQWVVLQAQADAERARREREIATAVKAR